MSKSQAEMVIAGGGVMGLSCAWRLAQRGIKTTILEQGRCGGGASRAALGALWPPPTVLAGSLQQLHRRSLWGFQDFLQQLQAASGLAVDYLRQGKLEFLLSPRAAQEAKTEAAHAIESWPRLESGPVMEILTSEQILRLEPHLKEVAPEAQLCRWSAQVNMDQLIAALTAACTKSGVEIHEDSPVTGLKFDSKSVTSVQAGERSISTAAVLLCAGIGTGRIEPALESSAPIKPVKGQALLLRTDKPIIRHIIKNGPVFLVPWPDGRILVGSTTEPDAGMDMSNTAEGVEFLLSGAIKTCPGLARAAIEKIWAGLRPTGPSHRPVMGLVPGLENLYVCAGHFKIGIGMTPLASQIMAKLISEGKTEFDLGELTPGPWNPHSSTA
jgi:glycine oxidase